MMIVCSSQMCIANQELYVTSLDPSITMGVCIGYFVVYFVKKVVYILIYCATNVDVMDASGLCSWWVGAMQQPCPQDMSSAVLVCVY